MLVVPEAFADSILQVVGADGAQWIQTLPGRTQRLLETWRLTADGPVVHGTVALVLPVRQHQGEPAALKVSWIDDETRAEARALAWWAGRGAVAVLDHAPQEGAMLLQRLRADRSLLDLPEQAAVTTAASLLRRLHVPGPDGLPSTRATAERWTADLPSRWREVGSSSCARLLDQVVETCSELAASSRPHVLLHGDFHYANVLATPTPTPTPDAGSDECWAAIDPKPLVGDAEFDLLPLLRNRWTDLVAAGDPARACQRRLDHLVDVTGLDPDRARAWALARTVDNALWGLQHDQTTFTTIAWTIADALR